ncbi:Glycosyl transferase, family 1 [Acididesulfobacillus acetoxydans]|uniref:Glycosyl transferase, family 1 n=1 Tax=Acididesulfobacillus acetoxydans TaxID=1561005 RepID=A0A8S0Y250_9FIRM|nr:glycosyltransferase family 4 protein [Acididesulfobacillus acetoxydans]CAA7600325.1 Glycosyl transferase, family 1 [Acididesulfobacillus acetoxydans]CEJ06101.1 Glycosyltransferase [Acididesulfobacillus acetoxydans]
MKVLFQIRPDYLNNPAGDTVQAVSTGRELKALGVDVTVSPDPNALLTDFDLIHIFNLTRIKESYMFFLNAQRQHKKIAVSPIYWNPESFLQREEAKPQDLAVWNLNQPMRSRVVRGCDLLLPNSAMERDNLAASFSGHAPCRVVPNGFPDTFPAIGPEPFRRRFPALPHEFVLCAARISPRKNQLGLAQACQSLGLTLVLAGPVNDRKYFNLVRSFHHVVYLGTLQGEILASAYAAARIHALPSWFETPGLSSLEAAACGAAVLSTDQGSPREYFRDLAVYVRPQENESLNRGIRAAMDHAPLPLTDHVRANYPWSRIARLTLEAYEDLLGGNIPPATHTK